MEAPVGLKLKTDATGVSLRYGHSVLSLGHHGKAVLGGAKEGTLPGKDRESFS